MRSSRRRKYEGDKPSSPMSRSEKKRFVIAFCILFILGMTLLSDFVALPAQHIDSAVIDKEHLEPHRGHTSTGASFLVPEKWQLSFNIKDQSSEIQVFKEFYDQTHVGDILKVSYTKSRIFREIEIISVDR